MHRMITVLDSTNSQIYKMVEDKLAAKLHKIASVPLGATIATFGLIGNIISIIVWNRLIKSKLKDNQSTGLYFIALAFCDGGLLVFFLLSDTLKSNNPSLSHNYIFASFWAWFAFPVFFIFVVASIWMVVGVTLNRYVMIQFPTRVRKIYSKSRTLVSIAIFFSFSVIVNIPHFFTYTVPCRNGTYSIEFTEYGKGKGSTNYEFWVHCIFLVLAPWLTIIVLNTLILRKLSKQMKKVKEMKGNSDKESKGSKTLKKERRERELTVTLLTVTFTFLLFLIWQCVTQCFYMLGFGKDKQMTSQSWHLVDSSFAFAKLGVVLNSSVNWILYCCSGTTFRKEMFAFLGGTTFGKHVVSFSERSSKTSTLTSVTGRSSTVIANARV